MKKLIFIVVFAVAAMAATAQKGVISTFATADTLNADETVYFTGPIFTGSDQFTVQAACDNIGGTSDGTLTLEATVDGTDWVPFTDDADILKGYATTGETDSLTITDGANISWIVLNNAFSQYRVKGVGTASDSTLVTVKYIRK